MNTQTRTRVPFDAKVAAVSALSRLAGGHGARPQRAHIQIIAEQHNVTESAVYRWWKDPLLHGREPDHGPLPDDSTGEEEPAAKGPFQVTLDDLTVYGQEQSMKGAWRRLKEAGVVKASYPTFARAMKAVDPGLLAAAKDGTKALAATRLYAQTIAPHAGHTYHVDHTDLDLWISPTHKHTRTFVRPTVTVVVDSYSGFIWAFPWYQPVNGDLVAAALAEVSIGSTVNGVQVGGIPEQVVLDNAGEHYSESVRHATARLGITFNPTNAYSSYQNGKAERAVQLLNNLMSNRAPGAIHAGTTWNNRERHLEPKRESTDPNTLLSARAFEQFLAEVVHEINTTIGMQRHRGLTRLEAWAADPTFRRLLPETDAWVGMLPTQKATYIASKNGLWYRDRWYVCARIEVGRKYVLRHLPTRRDFVEVFDEQGNRIGRAKDSSVLTSEELAALMAEREEIEAQARAIEQGIITHRRHEAALRNTAASPDEELEEPARLVDVLADPAQAKSKPRPKQSRVPVQEPAPAKPVAQWALAALEEGTSK